MESVEVVLAAVRADIPTVQELAGALPKGAMLFVRQLHASVTCGAGGVFEWSPDGTSFNVRRIPTQQHADAVVVALSLSKQWHSFSHKLHKYGFRSPRFTNAWSHPSFTRDGDQEVLCDITYTNTLSAPKRATPRRPTDSTGATTVESHDAAETLSSLVNACHAVLPLPVMSGASGSRLIPPAVNPLTDFASIIVSAAAVEGAAPPPGSLHFPVPSEVPEDAPLHNSSAIL